MRILFICHGNICRSTMAEFVMKDIVSRDGRAKDFDIASCGVSDEERGNPVHPGTVRKLREHGITEGVSSKRARKITARDYEDYDLLICMDQSNLRRCISYFGGDREGKIRMLLMRDVADPWYTGNFEDTWEDIAKGCADLWGTVKNCR